MEDDKVVLINSRVKHSGKLDQAIRISLLLLYAYSLIDQRQIKRSNLSQILNHTKLYDAHFKNWLAKCDEITKLDNGDTLELSMPGITAAKEILLEFLDASMDKGRVQFSTSQRRATKKRNSKKETGEDSKDSAERTRKTTPSSSKESPLQTVELLISENYFSSKRRISEIIAFIKDNKGIIIPSTNMSTVLVRLIKNGKIKREKNPTDGQYEYYR
jgi:ribosome maturation protein Sdo1